MDHSNSGAGMSDGDMFRYIYDHGYQGAWVWSDDPEQHQASGIQTLATKNGAAGLVHFDI